MAGNIYNNQSSAGDAGSNNYAINPYAMAMGLDQLRDNLVVTALITNYSQVARNQGSRFSNAVRVPKWGSLTAGTKTPGTAFTYEQPTMTKADITIDTHKVAAFLVEDFGGLFAPETREAYMREAGAVIAEAIEDDVIALYASAGRTLGSITEDVDVDFLANVNYYSRSDKWRGNAEKFIVLGPRGEQDLLAGVTLSQYAIQGGDQSALRNAALGQIFNFGVFASSAMPAYTGSSSAEHGMAFQREAMGIAFMDMTMENIPGVEMRAMNASDDNGNLIYSMRSVVDYSHTNLGVGVSVDTIYGCGVVNSTLLYDLVIGDY